ncbi:MAG: ATP-binding protein, partial [Nocardioides sp.]
VDRESAREKLAARIEEGAAKAAEDAKVKEMAREQKNERVTKQARKDDDGMLMDVVRSSAFKDFMRTAAREVARGMFKSGRR